MADAFNRMVNPDSNLFRFFNFNEVMQNPKLSSIVLEFVFNSKSKWVYILIGYLGSGSNPE